MCFYHSPVSVHVLVGGRLRGADVLVAAEAAGASSNCAPIFPIDVCVCVRVECVCVECVGDAICN